MGLHSRSTTVGTPGLHRGTWSPICLSLCGADNNRISPFMWVIPVSLCSPPPPLSSLY